MISLAALPERPEGGPQLGTDRIQMRDVYLSHGFSHKACVTCAGADENLALSPPSISTTPDSVLIRSLMRAAAGDPICLRQMPELHLRVQSVRMR